MALLEELSQAAELIKKAKNILLIPHAKMDCDGMSSALALYLILKKLQKNPSALCTDAVPESFLFLPSTDVFSEEIAKKPLGSNAAFMLSVNTVGKDFKDLQYEVKDGKVNILLFTSGENNFSEKDFSFLGASFHPDLIITLDSGDIPQLGKVYTDNTELFETVPVINIDHHISNTQFGDVNLVDFKACSTTEVIYTLLPYLTDDTVIDEDIATLLLAGMLTDTGSFQHANTTPKSLDIASVLIEKGARHQEIIKNLFKTKNISTLRLWGRLLTKLQNDPIYRMIWSSVSSSDLEETQAKSEDADGLIDELLSTTPGTELVLLVKEREDGIISTSIRSSSPLVDSVAFSQQFGGGGHKQAAGFKIRDWGGKSFDEVVSEIVYEAKKFQAHRLSLPLPKASILANSVVVDNSSPKEVSVPIEKDISSSSIPAFPFEKDFTAEQSTTAISESEDTLPPENESDEHDDILYRPDPIIFSQKELTPDESQLLGKENYGLPEPEKIIEKPSFDGFNKPKVQIDDFADFISQVQDSSKAEVFAKTQNARDGITEELASHQSQMHAEDNILASLHSSSDQISNTKDEKKDEEDPFLTSLKSSQ